jgi:hypothetical protein
MMRPAPATQPWPESVNWTAASAGGWPAPGPEPGGVVAVAEAPLAAQDADDVVPGDPAELAEFGVEPVPADAADVPAGRLDPAAVDPDDVAAQPAAEPATAKTASAEAAARRARDGGAVGPNV